MQQASSAWKRAVEAHLERRDLCSTTLALRFGLSGPLVRGVGRWHVLELGPERCELTHALLLLFPQHVHLGLQLLLHLLLLLVLGDEVVGVHELALEHLELCLVLGDLVATH